MIGGDSAAHDNQKMLYGILSKFLDLEGLARMGLFSKEAGIWHQQLKSGFNLHHTTSTGRVLDAAAALLGLSDINHYEGRAPMLLESMALAHLHKVKGRAPGFAQKEGHGAMPVLEEQDRLILKTTPLFEYLHSSILKTSSSSSQTSWSVRLSQAEKQSPGIRNKLAFETHCYLASGLLQMADQVKGDSAVTFSGGVAANTILSSLFSEQGVLLPDKLPPGDGGIAFGQLAWLLLARD